ncbi:MAG TPA: asparagine synthase (glutamine-hydrolyzing) [Gemmatimonadales bacterium]|nr:asparagine synthase (glutamine-hydrolyzing) [Gemmatimonadales bacterium]
MCGIVGVLGPSHVDEAVLQSMCRAVHHRGPDDSGTWLDGEAGVGLGHARLSILDLSCAGHQPMLSAGGRYAMVFNGEIYNHLELRAEIARRAGAIAWRGHSDTETLLAAIEVWGLEATLVRAVGMFAIALWDRERRTLALARDRLGEKPLYYGWQGGVLLFASELKAITGHPAFRRRIDRGALALLLRHDYIPAPWSIYEGIRKLAPGTVVTLSLADREPAPRPYWSVHDVVEAGLAHPFEGSPEEAVEQLDRHLREAVKAQMLADVPLGAFLSGGVDSSTIVALMQQQSSRPVRTFTIGFHEARYNEAVHAAAVAKHLGTDHTELYVSPREALDVIPNLPSIYCEPFADSSQIPTILVSRLARQSVTVSLSGDAGDELFGGYQRYDIADAMWRRLATVPAPMRHAVASALTAVPTGAWNALLRPVRGALPATMATDPGDRLHRGADVLRAHGPEDIYRRLVSLWHDPASVVLGATEPPTALTDRSRWPATDGFRHWMMATDLVSYLPDDILVKVDRAAMSVSLETRVPLLDHRVVEFAWRLPLTYKVRDGVGKWPLRQVLHRYVPRELIERPKMGFGVPIDEWLRGPLRDWADDLLDEARLRREGFFAPGPIRAIWEAHRAGHRSHHYQLWTVLMFQAWLAEHGGT